MPEPSDAAADRAALSPLLRAGSVLGGLLVAAPAAYLGTLLIGALARHRFGGDPLLTVTRVAMATSLAGFALVGTALVLRGVRGVGRISRAVHALAGLSALLLVGGLGVALGRAAAYHSARGLSPLETALLVVLLVAGPAIGLVLLTGARRTPGGSAWARLRQVAWALLPLLPLFLAALHLLPPRVTTEETSLHPEEPVPGCTRRCMNNVRQLATLGAEGGVRRDGWPAPGGRNYVLALVARRGRDASDPGDLEVLFCPCRPTVNRPRPADYAEVTPEALDSARFPTLTDYAGRRNDDPRYRLDARSAVEASCAPIVACTHHQDGAVVGFSDGRVRFMDRADLGLGPDDPIVVGEASKSPILRALSDE